MAEQKKEFIIKAEGMLCSGNGFQKTCFLRVNDGLIQGISEDVPEPANCEIIDFSSLTISPFLCDYHLHFSSRAEAVAESIGALLLRNGIGKAYEGGNRELAGLSARKILGGMPAIVTSGYALYKPGGYGCAIGRAVADTAGAAVAINDLLSCNVDYIKIINSGYYEPESGLISAGGFEAEELKSMVNLARERGLDVYCHANGNRAVREAVAAGVSAIVHGLYADDEIFAEMAERNIAFIPTVTAFQSLLAGSKIATVRHTIEKTVELQLSAIDRASQHNVQVLPGSDSGPELIPYGSAYSNELRLFLKAGIPFEKVIQIAAITTLAEGASADFILLDGLTVKYVVIRGQFLH